MKFSGACSLNRKSSPASNALNDAAPGAQKLTSERSSLVRRHSNQSRSVTATKSRTAIVDAPARQLSYLKALFGTWRVGTERKRKIPRASHGMFNRLVGKPVRAGTLHQPTPQRRGLTAAGWPHQVRNHGAEFS